MIKRASIFFVLISILFSGYAFGFQRNSSGNSRTAVNAKKKLHEKRRKTQEEKIIERKEKRQDFLDKEREKERKARLARSEETKERVERRKDTKKRSVRRVTRKRKARGICRCARRCCMQRSACEKRRMRTDFYTGLKERKRVASKERKYRRRQEREQYRDKKAKRVFAKKF